MGTEKTRVSQQRRYSEAYWARAKSISGVFEFDGVTFCRCRPTMQLVHIHPIFIAGTPSDARFQVVGKFFNAQNINHARVAERTAVVLLCERYEGGQQIERK